MLHRRYLSLFQVAPDGKLFNIEDKDALSKLTTTGLFQGGYWADLHKVENTFLDHS